MLSARPEDHTTVRQAPFFQDLKAYLIELTGLGYYEDKEDSLAHHIERRLSSTNFPGLGHYFEFIRSPQGRDELDRLIDQIAIGETYFFRNPAQFDALRSDILPERINARSASRSLRIWSAGCATGAEPYSIAILLEDRWPEILQSWRVEITGTDICGHRLERARRAAFSEWEMRGLPEDLRLRCFDAAERCWNLRHRYTRRVTFQQQNLKDIIDAGVATGPTGPFDVILCRNVLIYFDIDLMRRILSRMRELLADGGWLLVGHSEPFLEIAHFLTPWTVSGMTAYRRIEGPADNMKAPFVATPAARPTPAAPPPAPITPAFVPPPIPAPLPTLPPEPFPPEPAPPRKKEDDGLTQIRRLADAGQWEQAVSACDNYIAGNPLDPAGHFILALILENHGKTAAAFDALRRVVYLDRKHALAHYHIGRMHAHAGNRTQAVRALNNACELTARMAPDTPIDGGDGIRSDELQTLARRQLAGLLE